MKGQKWDEGKREWFSMPLTLLEPLADVFTAGVVKGYGRFNCLNPFDDSDRRFWDSTMRHMEACQLDSLAKDKETGCYHAAQAAFGMLLRLYNAQGGAMQGTGAPATNTKEAKHLYRFGVEKIICASGYFNPLHVGHIAYLEKAKSLGDKLIVIVNNDGQVDLKGTYPVMPCIDRARIVESLRCVDQVFVSFDTDASVCQSLEYLYYHYGVQVFAKGGDRDALNIPEAPLCKKLGIEIIDGIVPQLRQSSSYRLILRRENND
jgi:cytidyltransferase-like protein